MTSYEYKYSLMIEKDGKEDEKKKKELIVG